MFDIIASFLIGDTVGKQLDPHYRKLVVNERLGQLGVFKGVKKMKGCKPVFLDKACPQALKECVEITVESTDPLYFMVGKTLLITPTEAEYLDGVTDWGKDKVAGVCKFIVQTQSIRSST
jgi:hypothetical protein